MQAIDTGKLSRASELERINMTTFTAWQTPFLVTLGFFAITFVWAFCHNFIFAKKKQNIVEFFNDSSLLAHSNQVLGFCALVINHSI